MLVTAGMTTKCMVSPWKLYLCTIITDDALFVACSLRRNRFRKEQNIIPTTTTKFKNDRICLSTTKPSGRDTTRRVCSVRVGHSENGSVKIARQKQTHVFYWPARGDGNPYLNSKSGRRVCRQFVFCTSIPVYGIGPIAKGGGEEGKRMSFREEKVIHTINVVHRESHKTLFLEVCAVHPTGPITR